MSTVWMSRPGNTLGSFMAVQEGSLNPPPKAGVVSVLSMGRRSTGLLLAANYGGWYGQISVQRPHIYLVATFHSVDGDMTPQVVVYNANGQVGKHVILTFRVIGIERSSDIAVALYDPNYASNNNYNLNYAYYSSALAWTRQVQVNVGDTIVAVGESETYGSQIVSYGTVKDPAYSGHWDDVLVTCRLLALAAIEGASGSPVFRQADGELIGMLNGRFFTDDTHSVSVAVDSDLLSFVTEYMIRTWWAGPGTNPSVGNDIYQISSLIKRGFEKTYLGVIQEYVNIDSLAEYPALDGLWRLPNTTFGGILIKNFVHGYDTIKKEYITEPNHPFIATDIKTYSVLHGTQLYNLFYATKHPIVVKTITYQKWDIMSSEGTSVEVTEDLGEFDGLRGLSNFFFYGQWEPFTLGYYYLQNSTTWTYREELFTPTNVAYRTEDGNTIIQLNVGFPYPMYGIEEIGSIQFLSTSGKRRRTLKKVGNVWRWMIE